MFNPILLFLIALFLTTTPEAQALDMKIGPQYTFKTSSIDHSKIGPWITLDASLFGLPFHAHIDAAVSTLAAVNPGATSTSSAPDLKESKSGSVPFYGQVSTPLFGLPFDVGIQSYFTNLSAKAAGVPIAASVFFKHEIPLTASIAIHGAMAAGIQVTGFKPLTLLGQPEIGLDWKFSQRFELGLQGAAVLAYAASTPSAFVTYPRAALTLGFKL